MSRPASGTRTESGADVSDTRTTPAPSPSQVAQKAQQAQQQARAKEPDRGHRRAEPRARPRGHGGRHRVRHPGRRDPARVRPAARLGQGPPHPRAPRAGRRPRGRGLRQRDRQGRRLHGDLRPGRDQPRHADRRRLHGLGADRRDHRPGAARRRSAPTPSRRPTSAASRCRSPSTTTSSPTPTQIPRVDRRGVPHRLDRPPRTGARRHLQGRTPGPHHLQLAAEVRPAGLPPGGASAQPSRSARPPG